MTVTAASAQFVDDDCAESTTTTYPVKSVTFTTCGDLYQQWISRKRMYAKAAAGITLNVEYADTGDLCQPSTIEQEPITILALHGAPGSHHDYQPFIEHFASLGVRIIVPNFPGK